MIFRVSCSARVPPNRARIQVRRERLVKQVKHRLEQRAKTLRDIVVQLDDIARSEELYACELFQAEDQDHDQDQPEADPTASAGNNFEE
jgi:hypothetical protein